MHYSFFTVTIAALVLTACAESPEGAAEIGSAVTPTTPSQACVNSVSNGTTADDIGNPPVDFRGTWVLNTDRGANLGMMKAVNETMIASQTADLASFDIEDVFAGMTTERVVSYDLNGATVDNKAAMGAPNKTTSLWDGNKLVTAWVAEGAIAGTTELRTETRCITDDGNTLNITMTRAGNPDIEEALWFVYEKAE